MSVLPVTRAFDRIEKRMETLEEKIARVLKEEIAIVPYDTRWPEIFEQERALKILSASGIG